MTTAKVREDWDLQGNPLLGGRTLVYVPPEKLRIKKTHVVKVFYGSGEQMFPDVFRFETVEAARECWKSQQKKMASQGLKKRHK